MMQVDAAIKSQKEQAAIAASTLIARVGEQVRRTRIAKGISRRELSENSGVSPRYIAQLESGEGNISIGLLQKVAVALDCQVERLIMLHDPNDRKMAQVSDLYRAANADVQKSVLHLLDPDALQGTRARRLCLIGLRGAGKSTLGALVSKTLNLEFVELNDEVAAQTGIPVNEVISLYGQEGYRAFEAQALERVVATRDDMVLAVAGGIVAEPDTYRLLRENFHTIWLRATAQEHMERVRDQGDDRPMAGNPAAMEQLRSILTSREAHYAKALASLDTSGQNVKNSLRQLLTLIETRRFLK